MDGGLGRPEAAASPGLEALPLADAPVLGGGPGLAGQRGEMGWLASLDRGHMRGGGGKTPCCNCMATCPGAPGGLQAATPQPWWPRSVWAAATHIHPFLVAAAARLPPNMHTASSALTAQPPPRNSWHCAVTPLASLPGPLLQDNDIILCDGPCNRAYHVQCLVPPVDPEALPEEEGWLCPACDRKVRAQEGEGRVGGDGKGWLWEGGFHYTCGWMPLNLCAILFPPPGYCACWQGGTGMDGGEPGGLASWHGLLIMLTIM